MKISTTEDSDGDGGGSAREGTEARKEERSGMRRKVGERGRMGNSRES